MKFYGVILLLLVAEFSDQIQSQLVCYSCDNCDVMNPKNSKIETCEVELEALVAAANDENSETVIPETTTDFMELLEEDKTEETYMITDDFQDDNTMEMSTGEDYETMGTDMTTETLEETTTDYPIKSLVKRNAGPISYCYKFLARSGEYISSSSLFALPGTGFETSSCK